MILTSRWNPLMHSSLMIIITRSPNYHWTPIIRARELVQKTLNKSNMYNIYWNLLKQKQKLDLVDILLNETQKKSN